MACQGRILHSDWDRYDTRHAVFTPARMSAGTLEMGYWRAYRDFYRWSNILASAGVKHSWPDRLRHIAYAGAWKRCEPLWDLIIRARRVTHVLPLLEKVLESFGARAADPDAHDPAGAQGCPRAILSPGRSTSSAS